MRGKVREPSLCLSLSLSLSDPLVGGKRTAARQDQTKTMVAQTHTRGVRGGLRLVCADVRQTRPDLHDIVMEKARSACRQARTRNLKSRHIFNSG